MKQLALILSFTAAALAQYCPSGEVWGWSYYRYGCFPCPGGQVIRNYQCACPDGQHYSDAESKCVTCNNGRIVKDNKCVCPDGKRFNYYESKCLGCSGGGVYNDIGGARCFCYGVEQYSKSQDKCLRCTGGQIFQNDNCVCPPGQHYSNTQRKCLTCTGGNFENDQCVCPSGQNYSNSQSKCITCTGGQIFQNDQCVCTDGKKFSYQSSKCLGCTGGAFYGDSCHCWYPWIGPHYSISQDKCVTCTGGQSYQNGECVCPSGQDYSNTQKKCLTCTGGKFENDQCVCPSGQHYNPSLSKCMACVGTVFQNGKCVCPPGQGYSYSESKCVACDVYESPQSKCVMPLEEFMGPNTNIPFTEENFDKVWEGIKTLAGINNQGKNYRNVVFDEGKCYTESKLTAACYYWRMNNCLKSFGYSHSLSPACFLTYSWGVPMVTLWNEHREGRRDSRHILGEMQDLSDLIGREEAKNDPDRMNQFILARPITFILTQAVMLHGLSAYYEHYLYPPPVNTNMLREIYKRMLPVNPLGGLSITDCTSEKQEECNQKMLSFMNGLTNRLQRRSFTSTAMDSAICNMMATLKPDQGMVLGCFAVIRSKCFGLTNTCACRDAWEAIFNRGDQNSGFYSKMYVSYAAHRYNTKDRKTLCKTNSNEDYSAKHKDLCMANVGSSLLLAGNQYGPTRTCR